MRDYHSEKPDTFQDTSTDRLLLSLLSLAIFAAYLNIIIYGFIYGTGNQEFELPYVRWLLRPSLYQNDLLRVMFIRFPSVFWPAIADLSHLLGVHNALFIAFLLTKLIFFVGIAAILHSTVRKPLLAWLIASALALSPFLNNGTPFGGSDILDRVQTQTPFAVALLVCACWGLLKKRWWPVAALVAAAIFVNSLFAFFFVIPLAVFAVIDWRSHKREIVLVGIFFAAVSILYLLFYAGRMPNAFPAGYAKIVVWRDPLHWRLFSHPREELLRGAGILLAAIMTAAVARRHRTAPLARLELLSLSFGATVAFGAVAGEFSLRPAIILLQPLRADSFLFLLALVLIESYAANLLVESPDPAVWVFAIAALLLPLVEYEDLLLCLFACGVISLLPDRFLPPVSFQRWTALFATITLAVAFQHFGWDPLRISIVLGLAAVLLLPYARGSAHIAAFVVGVGFFLFAWQALPSTHRLWNPERHLNPHEEAWRAVQLWAKANTSVGTWFMVPPAQSGFEVFSERAIWVDWKVGTAVAFSDPSLLPQWVDRMKAIDCGPQEGKDIWQSMDNYEREPLGKLEAVAKANGIAYIVQTRKAAYRSHPVYENNYFVVYRVGDSL